MPSGNRNHLIETYCRLTELEFGKNLEKNKFVQKNISKEQQQALSDLERNDSILINLLIKVVQ